MKFKTLYQGSSRRSSAEDDLEQIFKEFKNFAEPSNNDLGILRLKISQKDILFEFGHSTPNMNIAVAWKGPSEKRRNVKIFQSEKNSGVFTSQALKFKLPKK